MNSVLMRVQTAVCAVALVSGGSCDQVSPRSTVFRTAVAGHIGHVVFIIQENRSFDNLFHRQPGADAADYGYAHDGTRVELQPVSLTASYDIGNGLEAFTKSYNGGNMDGYDKRPIVPLRGARVPLRAAQYPAYAYVPLREVRPYRQIAEKYVVADRMFQSNIDQSFAAHLYLIAGQSNHTVNTPNGFPWGCDAPANVSVPTLTEQRELGRRVFPCFNFRTLADELDSIHLEWRYYAPAITFRRPAQTDSSYVYYASALPANVRHSRAHQDSAAKTASPAKAARGTVYAADRAAGPRFNVGQLWSAYDAIARERYGRRWKANVVSPPAQVLRDIRSRRLAAVTWIVPDWVNSDHPFSRSASGPSWVAAIVNEIGRSPFWNDTAILITWDDSGGWYDHVPPPQVDFDGLGVRVPLLVVSPYAKHGVVIHKQYEFGSLLRLAEAAFGLPQLAASDARANDLEDCFDFTTSPGRFEPINTSLPTEYFLHQQPSRRRPDGD